MQQTSATLPSSSHSGKKTSKQKLSKSSRLKGWLKCLGPGLITGAADDDPSGIATFSIAGAQFGYATLWFALFSFPLMAAVQMMCARLGIASGEGLGGVLRRYYPRWLLWTACSLLLIANTINIGADLAGMSDATEMLTGIKTPLWVLLYAAFIVVSLVWLKYHFIVRIFKWLTLVLFSYIAAAFLAHPGVLTLLRFTFLPRIQWTGEYLVTLVGLLGTTISPYLFFWQASQEVEEQRAIGRHTLRSRRGATPKELEDSRTDVITGMFFSNLIVYFITATAAATLHLHGYTNITTARQAAETLRPLAGNGAYWLFSLGMIGTGMLAVPVLAGSSAYAVAEGATWRASLEAKPRRAPEFYALLGISVIVGLALDSLGISSVKMLFWTAVINGVLAPPLIVVLVLATSNARIMGKNTNPPLLRWLGWLTAALMSLAAAAMFITLG
jgi:NRAMP (natural resistance-associated macrophage protein)-like metal ion transporter